MTLRFLRRWIEDRTTGVEHCRHLPFLGLSEEEMRNLAELAAQVGRDAARAPTAR